MTATQRIGSVNGTATCSVRSATCHKVDPGFSVAGNILFGPGASFPPAAAAIIAAAGPRYAVAGGAFGLRPVVFFFAV